MYIVSYVGIDDIWNHEHKYYLIGLEHRVKENNALGLSYKGVQHLMNFY